MSKVHLQKLGMNLKLLCTSLILFYLASLMPKPAPKYSPYQKSTIAKSYLLGQKRGLSRKVKKAHHKLHLLHLMTPSGLHLSSALLFIKRFSHNPTMIRSILIIVSLISLYLGDFHARATMLKYGIPDLRTFFECDTRWLAHYGFDPLKRPNSAQR